MADKISADRRSQNMAAIKASNTKPELQVRRLVHRLGYRFRLQRRDLPGKPDMVLPRHRAVIFVHGCFWHQHDDPSCNARMPKSRLDYWRPKLEKNMERDRANQARLSELGWRVLVVWECETRDLDAVANKVERFLSGEDATTA